VPDARADARLCGYKAVTMDSGRWGCRIGISSPRLTCHPKGQACRRPWRQPPWWLLRLGRIRPACLPAGPDDQCVVLSLSCGARLRPGYPQRYCTLRMPVAHLAQVISHALEPARPVRVGQPPRPKLAQAGSARRQACMARSS
jgi:hypothetical protein